MVENQLRKREGKFGVYESVSESLMWACEALMLGFLDSLREGKKDMCHLFNLWSI